MYEFTNNSFFKNVKPNFDQVLMQINPTNILIIGSDEGAAASYFIEKLSNTRKLIVRLVEENVQDDSTDQNLNFAKEKAINTPMIVRDCQLSILKNLTRYNDYYHDYINYYDLVYLNFEGDTSEILTNIILSFKLLKIGGSLVINHYNWTKGDKDINNFPKLAIDLFTIAFANKIHVMPSLPNQIFIVKLED